MTELFVDAKQGWLGRLWDKLNRRPSAKDRAVLEAMYEKYGGVRVVYPTADESLARRSGERRREVEQEITRLNARLGKPHDSQNKKTSE